MKENFRERQSTNHGAFVLASPIYWEYVSGFFDGECSITVETRPASNVLVISITISQKNRPSLEAISEFLGANGIFCSVCLNHSEVHEIRVRRIENICKLLHKLNLILKRGQALATLAYFEGRITGNKLLEIFDSEYKLGRRKSTSLRPGSNFPLTHTEALRLAQGVRTSAARAANTSRKREFLAQRIKLLPSTFETADVAGVLECSKVNARYSMRQMEANGLVSCRRVGTRGRGKLVCVKL